MSTDVKYIHSGMPGAPVLNGTAGALIGVLDACLVNGFGLTTVTALEVEDGIATATFASGHPFSPDCVALFAGATPSALNGEKRIIATATNWVTFDATGVADGAATGTITAKVAPLGWSKPFSGTNKAAYKQRDLEATGMYLRVDDTGTVDARVVGYETMTDADTGTGPFPTPAMRSGGCYWHKANSTSPATARDWWLVGDGRLFYIAIRFTIGTIHNLLQGAFGDILPISTVDSYHCILIGRGVSAPSSLGSIDFADGWGGVQNTLGATGMAIARDYTGVGGAQWVARAGLWNSGQSVASGQSNGSNVTINYPNGPDASLILLPVYTLGASGCRGTLPGLNVTPQHLPNAPLGETGIVISGMGLTAGQKRVLFLAGYGTAAPSSNTTCGAAFIDPIGPWR